MANNRFISFCVYFNPADFPGKYVIRKWVGMDPERLPEVVGDTLEEVREKLLENHPGLVRFVRNEGDDPVIVESWL